MHLDSIFLMYVRAPFQTFLRFVDILSLIISNLPCARERALSNVPPSEQYSTLDYLTFLSFFFFFFLQPPLRSIAERRKKKSKFNYIKRT